jgi:hypothetical protein
MLSLLWQSTAVSSFVGPGIQCQEGLPGDPTQTFKSFWYTKVKVPKEFEGLLDT